jgi:hypothetical protein
VLPVPELPLLPDEVPAPDEPLDMLPDVPELSLGMTPVVPELS